MISTLLAMALQLLLTTQQPNVPLSLKNEAVQVAIIAIQYAQENATTTVQLAPTIPITPATITVVPTQPDTTPVFGSISTTTQFSVPIPQNNAIIPAMPISFSGWDGSQVVLSGGNTASTVITLTENGAPAVGKQIKIFDIPYNHPLLPDNAVSDANGQYTFNVGKTLTGGFDVKIQVPALNIDQTTHFLVSN